MVNVINSKTNEILEDRVNKFTLGFYGKEIDDRSAFSINYLKSNSNKSMYVEYSKDEIMFFIDNDKVQCHELDEYFSVIEDASILVDVTSINVATLALLLKALKKVYNTLYFLYVEPDTYFSTSNIISSLETDFELSESILGFESSGVPTITKPLQANYNYVFLLGFEEERTLNAIEVHDISSNQGRFVFGVPAFKPHWANESLKKNVRVLKDFNLREHVSYCGANDLKVCLSILIEHIKEVNSNGINVIPIGTKPHSLAAILLYISFDKVNILFDQPVQRNNRSSGIGTKHLYKVTF